LVTKTRIKPRRAYIEMPLVDHIDQIIYINLDSRQDRRELFEAEMVSHNLPYERFPAIPHDPGIVGCGKSHLAVLKMAKERGNRYTLIMEDDFVFLKDKDEVNADIDRLFESGVAFDVCFISYGLYQSEPVEGHPFLTRALEAQTASGYIVAHHYLDTLIALYEEAMPMLEITGEHWHYANDQVWKRLQLVDRWICFTDRIGRQRPGFSDNSKTWFDYDV